MYIYIVISVGDLVRDVEVLLAGDVHRVQRYHLLQGFGFRG